MNIALPTNQTVYNTPLYQQLMKKDPKYGDAIHRPPDGADPSIYLTRLLNTNLESWGKDCVISGLKTELYYGLGTHTIRFKINPGLCIVDNTLLEITDGPDVVVDKMVQPTDDFDHFVVSLLYEFQDSVVDNPITVMCTLWNSQNEQIEEAAGSLIVGLFQFIRDENDDIVGLEDRLIDRFNGQPHPPIVQRNINGDFLRESHVRPNPAPLRKIFKSLFDRGVVDRFQLFQRETSGLMIHRAPVLTINDVFGNEDDTVTLPVTAALVESDSLFTLTVEVHNVPGTANLTRGADQGGGVWVVPPAELPNLQIELPPNSDQDFALEVRAISTEDADPGNVNMSIGTINVTIFAVADNPNLTVENAAAIDIGLDIDLSITSSLVDPDGSETLTIEIQNVPVGASLNNGVDQGGGTWLLQPVDLTGLQITPPDWENNFTIDVVATATETSNASTASVTSQIFVRANPNVNLSVTSPVLGQEDIPLLLGITSSLMDNSHYDLTIEVQGVPTGATLNNGVDQGGGIYLLQPADLTGLQLTPPLNSDQNFTLIIKAISTDNVGTDNSFRLDSISVELTAVTDVPTLNTPTVPGWSDSTFLVDIQAALTDLDGSEELVNPIVVTGLLPSVVFNKGTDQGGGTWHLDPATDLTDLMITIPVGLENQFDLTVALNARETSTGLTKQVVSTLTIIPQGAAIQTLLYVLEMDLWIEIDPGDIIKVEIFGLPLDAVLSAGTNQGGGHWIVDYADLPTLIVQLPYGTNTQEVTVTVTYNPGTGQEQVSGNLTIISQALIQTPLDVLGMNLWTGIDPGGVIEFEIFDFPLDAVLWAGIDPGDVMEVEICGLPLNAVLSAGTNQGGGCWIVDYADLATLTVQLPYGTDTQELTVTVTVTYDPGTGPEQVSGNLTVSVGGTGGPEQYILGDFIGNGNIGSFEWYLGFLETFK